MTTKRRKSDATWQDPIVAEVRKAREALYADSGYDLHELGRRLREEQGLSARLVVTRPPRRSKRTALKAPKRAKAITS